MRYLIKISFLCSKVAISLIIYIVWFIHFLFFTMELRRNSGFFPLTGFLLEFLISVSDACLSAGFVTNTLSSYNRNGEHKPVEASYLKSSSTIIDLVYETEFNSIFINCYYRLFVISTEFTFSLLFAI